MIIELNSFMTDLACDFAFVESLSALVFSPLDQSHWLSRSVFPGSHEVVGVFFRLHIVPNLAKIEDASGKRISICQI